MNRRQRRHAARRRGKQREPGALVVRNGRAEIRGEVPGLGRELARGYFARRAARYQAARDAADGGDA